MVHNFQDLRVGCEHGLGLVTSHCISDLPELIAETLVEWAQLQVLLKILIQVEGLIFLEHL